MQPVVAKQLSIGELDALILKACRGAGYSWGLSQEAGHAAAWLAIRGLPAAAFFAEFLKQINGIKPLTLAPQGLNVQVADAKGPRCPLMTGALISDTGWLDSHIETGPVYSPVILIPFVASCAKSAATDLLMSFGEAEVWLNSAGEMTSLPKKFDAVHTASLTIASIDAPTGEQLSADSRRARVSEEHLQSLENLAQLTYVPASDQSRHSAGAGLTDND